MNGQLTQEFEVKVGPGICFQSPSLYYCPVLCLIISIHKYLGSSYMLIIVTDTLEEDVQKLNPCSFNKKASQLSYSNNKIARSVAFTLAQNCISSYLDIQINLHQEKILI